MLRSHGTIVFSSALTSHLRPAKSSSASSKKCINNFPTSSGVPEVTHDAVQGSSSRTTGAAHSHGCVHQRTRPLYSSPEHGRPDMGERTPLLTLGAKAISMTMASVALVVTFVVLQIAAHSLPSGRRARWRVVEAKHPRSANSTAGRCRSFVVASSRGV